MTAAGGERRLAARIEDIYEAPRIRTDLLLVNATSGDRTPIVAEVKVAGDENALLALVQALAAAAQLSPESQRQRLVDVYPEEFADVPSRIDVYVITHDSPTR